MNTVDCTPETNRRLFSSEGRRCKSLALQDNLQESSGDRVNWESKWIKECVIERLRFKRGEERRNCLLLRLAFYSLRVPRFILLLELIFSQFSMSLSSHDPSSWLFNFPWPRMRVLFLHVFPSSISLSLSLSLLWSRKIHLNSERGAFHSLSSDSQRSKRHSFGSDGENVSSSSSSLPRICFPSSSSSSSNFSLLFWWSSWEWKEKKTVANDERKSVLSPAIHVLSKRRDPHVYSSPSFFHLSFHLRRRGECSVNVLYETNCCSTAAPSLTASPPRRVSFTFLHCSVSFSFNFNLRLILETFWTEKRGIEGQAYRSIVMNLESSLSL